MATNKHIDRICIGAMILALLLTILFMNGEALGLQTKVSAMGYEARLFDTSKVHTIDIVIDDWDTFLATAQSEEYSLCDVVIDGEAFQGVGIRGKGNTSLSTVESMDSDRYSFKIEFDQYDSTRNYYGLDKLSLNNLIQDNTMMKDYLTYRMMNEFGVAAPLCSFVYITVNGEDWGLYLAVEGVEESFLQRNYGNSYGELYKPDSTNLGGGRGNGQDFSPEDFTSGEGDVTPPMGGDFSQIPNMPEGFSPDQMGGMMPDMGGGDFPQMPDFDSSAMGDMGMGTSDVKLQYIDDNLSSYGNIFTGAKTDATVADQQRLVKSLRALSERQNLNQVLDMESVLRYFVVHNFVVNADSYTGTMIHNYYLYEQDGQLSMIPWDYNLAFGTFQSNDAAGIICDDIDAPLSVTGEGRPMIDWIFASEEYTEQYHTYFREFLDTVDAGAIIAQAKALIAPYVEKDPTKFCTYEEFESGVDTLAAFCDLRSESVSAQLAGGDGIVDTAGIDLSKMGTMSRSSSNKGEKPSAGESTGDIQQMPNQSVQRPSRQPSEGVANMQPNQQPNGAMPQPDPAPLIVLGITVLILVAGLIFAFKFKR